MNQFRHLLIPLLLVFTFASNAQSWFENTRDVNGNANFFDIQKEAEKYFENIDIQEKGKGYKPYKRWEQYWTDRVYEDGSFPEAGINEKNWNEYLKTYKNGDRSMTANWTSLGPTTTPGGYSGIGRINCVAFHPTNANIIWVGSPGGGLWKSTDGGSTWNTTFDNQVVLGVSAIVIHPTTPNTMYIATGDGDGSDTYSTGVLKSLDGGVTWNTTGLNWAVTNQRRIRRLIMDPDDSNMLLAATTNGLYRTTNGGTNWTQMNASSFYDVEANPDASSNTFYASTSSAIYRSTNNGANWTNVQTISGSNRISLAVSPNNISYVYALSSLSSNNGFNGIYRSENSGASYTVRATTPNLLGWNANGGDTGGQGWYDLALAVDPTDAEIVYTGGVNCWKSTNGGTGWSLRTHWSGSSGVQTIHADHHVLEWQDNTTLWLGCDGGVYKTTNGGVNWTNRSNGLIISQMYRIDVSQLDTKLITGLQDNGTKVMSTSGTWSDAIGGDGMDCAIRPDVTTVLYGSYQNGRFSRSTNSGTSFSSITVPDQGSGAWITPITIDPNNTQTIFIAFNRVHKSTNQGSAWTTISDNLNSSDLTYIQVAPSNSDYIYTGRTNALYRTIDGGSSWTTMTVPTGSGYNDLSISPTDPNTIWIVRTGYNSGSKVYKSTNGGSTWTNISGTLPNLAANCIIYQNNTADGIYVGMDVGIYYRDNTMSDWELYNAGIPNVEIFDLKIKYNTSEIMAATYGRGAWKSPLRGSDVCPGPSNVVPTNLGVTTAVIQWTASNPPPFLGYEYAVSTSATPPVSGTATSGITANFSNLNSNTGYYFHVRSKCSESEYSAWNTAGPHLTQTTCNNVSTDTGGSSGNYGNNENITRYICPDSPFQKTDITFTSFGVEALYDALYIHDGNSINDPIFSSGNPATLANYPAGGYYGTTLPGTFTSTHNSGCLTLHFLSDGGVTGSGWSGNVSCIDICGTQVRNTEDDGHSSLRNIMACALPNESIIFNPSVHNDTIKLLSPIVVDKNLTLSSTTLNITIKSNYSGHIFEILPGNTLTINNIHFIGGSGNNSTRVLLNQGNLIMTDVDILDTKVNLGTGKSIDNQGNMSIFGLYHLRGN
ncbi:MAG: hypothetical protein WAT79_11210 [Saprospiraceae bacterium]